MPAPANRARKLVGSLLLLAFITVYAFAAALLGALTVAEMPNLVATAYYLVAGFLWIFPAIRIIRWIQRPEEGG